MDGIIKTIENAKKIIEIIEEIEIEEFEDGINEEINEKGNVEDGFGIIEF